MRKKVKRILALLLAVGLAVSVMTGIALSAPAENDADPVSSATAEAVQEEPADVDTSTTQEEPAEDADEPSQQEEQKEDQDVQDEADAEPAPDSEEQDTEEPADADDQADAEEPASTGEALDQTATVGSGDKTVTVRTTAEAGVLPEGAKLVVKQLANTDSQYKKAADKLDDSKITYDGLLALDVSFEFNGDEVEPNGSVDVQFKLGAGLLPEDADADTLAVQHLTNSGKVETVADAGSVAVQNQKINADFTVDSFSTFTITYRSGNTTSEITVHIVDTAGRDLTPSSTVSNKDGYTSWTAISSYTTDIKIEGYKYAGAHLGSYKGDAITYIKYGWRYSGWRYSNAKDQPWGYENGSEVGSNHIYLVYSDINGAQVYYLLTPTSDPDSNSTNQWGSVVQYNGVDAVLNDMTGAPWTNDKNVFKQNADLAQYIKTWPDGSTGAEWTLSKEEYPDVYQAVYDKYKEKLKEDLNISDLQLNDITEIKLIPHKISKDNGTYPDKHIDCTISVTCSKAYVARFNVMYPGNTGYTNVSAENKKINNNIPESIAEYSNPTTVPAIKVVDGITYAFDGWYNEANEKVQSWEYTPNTAELADGTVNFYARYVKATTSITVEKQVTGNMGDTNKDFSFTWSYGEGEGQSGTFSLKDDGRCIIENIPIGATLTLTETNADGYTISAKYGTTSLTGKNNEGMTFTIDDTNKMIVVTNEKKMEVPNGLTHNMTPYIIMVVLAAGAGVYFVVRRRPRGRHCR